MSVEVARYFQNELEICTIITGDKWKQNCYIVKDIVSNQAIVIDPGDNSEAIIEEIDQQIQNLKYIILTHAHHDHFGAAETISEKYNVKCILNKKDQRLLRHASLFALRFGNRIVQTPHKIEFIEEDISLPLGKKTFKLVNTPGHSEGSKCVFFDGCIFTGDTLLYKSVGRTDLPGGNDMHLLSSIGKIEDEIEDDVIVFPGHGRSFKYSEVKEWLKQSKEHFEKISRYNSF